MERYVVYVTGLPSWQHDTSEAVYGPLTREEADEFLHRIGGATVDGPIVRVSCFTLRAVPAFEEPPRRSPIRPRSPQAAEQGEKQ